METNKALELKNKVEELKSEYHRYKENTEDGEEKRRHLNRIQIEIGRNIKRLVLVLKEEGYTTSEIARKLRYSELKVRKLGG